jgi:hypothetical protein
MSFEYSLNLLGTFIHEKRDVLATFLPSEATKGLHFFLQIIYWPFNTVVILTYSKYLDLRPRKDYNFHFGRPPSCLIKYAYATFCEEYRRSS